MPIESTQPVVALGGLVIEWTQEVVASCELPLDWELKQAGHLTTLSVPISHFASGVSAEPGRHVERHDPIATGTEWGLLLVVFVVISGRVLPPVFGHSGSTPHP